MATEHIQAEFPDLRAAAIFLLRHWRDELQALFGSSQGRVARGQKPEPTLQFSAGDIVLGFEEAGQFVELSRVRRDGDVARLLSAAIVRCGLSGEDVRLRFSGGDVLRPTVKLPSARQSVLAGALRYELEQLTPLDPEALYFDYAINARDRPSNSVLIGLRIIRKDIVDEAVAYCHGAGLKVAVMGFEDDFQDSDPRRFPIDRSAHRRRQWRKCGAAVLAGASVVLFVALVIAAYARGSSEVDALNDNVASEGVSAARVEHIAREVSATRRAFATLAREKREPLAISTLADLTHAMPNGTWLTDISIDGRKVRIQGNSPDASELIGLIDSSGTFANAQFEAPVVQDPSLHAEHFSMVFDVVRTER